MCNFFSSPQSGQAMSLLVPDCYHLKYPLFILALCFMKHCSKTNDFNFITSVSSSRKLDLNGWLRLGVASVIGVFGLDCMWGPGVFGITSETS